VGSLTLVDIGEIRAESGDGFKDGGSIDVSLGNSGSALVHTDMGHQEP
jgi:hypothetical protein